MKKKKQWENVRIMHYYVAMIPWWDHNLNTYKFKARPCVLMNDSGGDVIVLPMTSNDNPDGTKKKSASQYEVEVKLNRFGIIKVNKPMTISKEAIVFNKDGNPKMGQQVETSVRRQIKSIFEKYVVLPKEEVR